MMQPGGRAVADEDEGAGPGLQHEGKILRAHHRRRVDVDALASGDLRGNRGRKRRLPLVIAGHRSEEHTSELQSPDHLVCRLLLEKKKKKKQDDLRIRFVGVYNLV